MRLYDTVIFDLDGTLLNTLEDLMNSVNTALLSNGFPPRSLDEIRRFVGNGIARLIHLSVPHGTPDEREVKCLVDFKAHYTLNMMCKTAPYPGSLDMLRSLKQDGYRLAVVSNKFDQSVKSLCEYYFGDLLSEAIGESEGFQKKPAPDLVEHCLSLLGVSSARAVYVGDSDVDIQTAYNAGLPCISVSWGFRDRSFLESSGAECIADTPEELLSFLKQQ